LGLQTALKQKATEKFLWFLVVKTQKINNAK
jgi:hypothetical protein